MEERTKNINKMITFAYIGYRGDACPSTDYFLEKHRENFDKLCLIDLQGCQFLLVDDGSQTSITKQDFFGLNFTHRHSDCITYAKILEDIPWNVGGARNLAFEIAKTEWVYILDLDYYVKAQNINDLLSLVKGIEKTTFFKTSRDRPDKPVPPGCFCCRREDFIATYGYNESLVGTYNCGEAIVFEQLKKICFYQEFPQIFLGYFEDPNRNDPDFRLQRSTSREKGKKIQKCVEEIRQGQYNGFRKLNFFWTH